MNTTGLSPISILSNDTWGWSVHCLWQPCHAGENQVGSQSLSLFSIAIIPNSGIFVKLNRQYFVSFSVNNLISKKLVCRFGHHKRAIYVRFRFPHPIMVVLLRGFNFHIRFIHHLSLLLYSYYLIFSYHCQVFSALNVKNFPLCVELCVTPCGNPWPAAASRPHASVSAWDSAF